MLSGFYERPKICYLFHFIMIRVTNGSEMKNIIVGILVATEWTGHHNTIGLSTGNFTHLYPLTHMIYQTRNVWIVKPSKYLIKLCRYLNSSRIFIRIDITIYTDQCHIIDVKFNMNRNNCCKFKHKHPPHTTHSNQKINSNLFSQLHFSFLLKLS